MFYTPLLEVVAVMVPVVEDGTGSRRKMERTFSATDAGVMSGRHKRIWTPKEKAKPMAALEVAMDMAADPITTNDSALFV